MAWVLVLAAVVFGIAVYFAAVRAMDLWFRR